jgi:type IV pilus assembly protein PilE
MSAGHNHCVWSSRAGFTLVEVLVVLAIVALLVALAYPSYTHQVLKSRRADGHALLYEAAQRQQQHFTECNAFSASVAATGNSCPGSSDEGLDMSASSQEGYYALSINASATTFTLTAAPQGTQTSDSDCGSLTLTHLNIKGCTASSCSPAKCW